MDFWEKNHKSYIRTYSRAIFDLIFIVVGINKKVKEHAILRVTPEKMLR